MDDTKKTYNFELGFGVLGRLIVMNSGSVRPATPQELILWQKYLEGPGRFYTRTVVPSDQDV